MLQEGEQVIVAVSGGADSVCLLHLLTVLREEWNITVRGVHIHHGLRGREADRDAAYVEGLSKKLEVPCLVVHKEVEVYAGIHGISVEEAGRDLRYQVLEEEAARLGGAKIAVAHHSDDQAETILHNLFRGSSLKGLGGMAPVRGNIIRPLLAWSRADILQYLKEHQIAYCEDSTNASLDYTRNKLRNGVLPMVVSQINTAAVEHILHSGRIAAQADAYLSKVAGTILKAYGIFKPAVSGQGYDGIGIDQEMLLKQEPIIRSYVIMEMLSGVCGSRKDLCAGHVSRIEGLVCKQVGAVLHLPYALTARKTYSELWIASRNYKNSVEKSEEKGLLQLEYSKFDYEEYQKIPQNEYTKWFDYDKIKGTLSVRVRQTGDYITLKDGRRKTVKAFMIDEKIPREQREMVSLLAEGNHVLWIVGYRISEYYKVTDKTKQILQVKINGGKDHGR